MEKAGAFASGLLGIVWNLSMDSVCEEGSYCAFYSNHQNWCDL